MRSVCDFGANLDPIWPPKYAKIDDFGPLEAVSAHLGGLFGRLKRSWAVLEAILGRLGGVLSRLGGVLGRLGGVSDAMDPRACPGTGTSAALARLWHAKPGTEI